MEDIEKKTTDAKTEENGIDFGAMWQSVKRHKKLYWKVCGVAFVLACVYAFSLPRSYTCKVMLAPELSTSTSRSSLSALASSFGLSLGTGRSGSEALFPTLYPDLMNSVDFKTSLFPVKVRRDKDTQEMTYYDYLLNEQKRPWWSSAIGSVMKGIGSLLAGSDTVAKVQKPVDPFRLTKRQTAVSKMINNRVVCDVDKKTLVITIQVTDQDPLVCATMADSVQERLQTFITEYRTSKARNDLEYAQLIYAQTRDEYEVSNRRYVAAVDANWDVINETAKAQLEALNNEQRMKYQTFSAAAQKLEAAKAKLQEATPVITVLQGASVPQKPAGPKRLFITAFLMAFATFLCSVYILSTDRSWRT